MAINVVGPVSLTAALVPAMLDQSWGRIVNVSSGIAVHPAAMIGGNAYAAAKAALEAHTLNLAAELAGTGVTVNGFRPGTVDTGRQAGSVASLPGPDRRRAARAVHPFARRGLADSRSVRPCHARPAGRGRHWRDLDRSGQRSRNRRRHRMTVHRGLLALLEAKPGKGGDLGAFLEAGRALAVAEEGTVTWYAFRITDTSYGIFDTFETEDALQAHLGGEIPKALAPSRPGPAGPGSRRPPGRHRRSEVGRAATDASRMPSRAPCLTSDPRGEQDRTGRMDRVPARLPLVRYRRLRQETCSRWRTWRRRTPA